MSMSGIEMRLRVEEALEQQVVADRVEVGDAQAVGHRAAGGADPRPGPTRMPRVRAWRDEVPHDEEVRR